MAMLLRAHRTSESHQCTSFVAVTVATKAWRSMAQPGAAWTPPQWMGPFVLRWSSAPPKADAWSWNRALAHTPWRWTRRTASATMSVNLVGELVWLEGFIGLDGVMKLPDITGSTAIAGKGIVTGGSPAADMSIVRVTRIAGPVRMSFDTAVATWSPLMRPP